VPMVIERFQQRFAGAPSLSFAQFMEFALYDEAVGFYSGTGQAGRRADFLTSPEVGPLFGALLARRLDQLWNELDCPDPFVVVEVGAGPGTLARSIALAAPECAAALRYVMTEISAPQRALHADHLVGYEGEADEFHLAQFIASGESGPRFVSSEYLPAAFTGVVIANELLDNLPFDIVRHDGNSNFERLDVEFCDESFEFTPRPVDLPPEVSALLAASPAGEWLPWQHAARLWVNATIGRITDGSLIVIDYGETKTSVLAERQQMGWLRTFVGNERGGHPLDEPGSRDITTDVAFDQITLDHQPSTLTTQAEWLQGLGIDELVEEGRRLWKEKASAPDVGALRARSRIREAEALLESGGLGDFLWLEWRVGAGI